MAHWNCEIRLLEPVEVQVFVRREDGIDRIKAVAPEFGYVIDRTNRKGLYHAVQNMERDMVAKIRQITYRDIRYKRDGVNREIQYKLEEVK